MTKSEKIVVRLCARFVIRASDFLRHSSFGLRHFTGSSSTWCVVALEETGKMPVCPTDKMSVLLVIFYSSGFSIL
jgi:hypothetical protein